MNTLEDRLRDAYQAAAQTVRPQTVLAGGLRGLHDREAQTAPVAKRGGHWRRWLIPLAAAAAVTAVVVGTTVLTQQTVPPKTSKPGRHGVTASKPLGTPRYFVALNWTTHPAMFAVNAVTGAKGQTIALPSAAGKVDAVATGDGRTFVVGMSRPNHCSTTLYRFTLSEAGHASTLTEVATVPGVIQSPGNLAAAGDGQTIAYDTSSGVPGCPQQKTSHPLSNYQIVHQPIHGTLYVVNLATRRSRDWTYRYTLYSSQANLYYGGVSLSEDGSSVAFGDWVLPASAPPGTVASRGREVAHLGEFGTSTSMNELNLAPDGKSVYFGTSGVTDGKPTNLSWQLRVFSLVTGRTSLVHRFAGDPGAEAALSPDPTGKYLLVESISHRGGRVQLARIDVATGQVTELDGSWAEQAAIAW